MKLFRRKQSPNTMPPEVAEYYQTEQRRERKGMAWLMTLLALLVTVAIVLGLFLAGRWLYRAISNDDKPTATTQGQQGSGNNPADAPAATDATPEPNPATDEPQQDSPATEPRDTTDTTDSEPAPSSPAQDEPAAQSPQTDELSDTGPGETAMVLFVVTAMIVFAARTRRVVQRQNNR